MDGVFEVALICSDEGCAVEIVEVVWDLGELERLACADCGCTLEALAFSAASEPAYVARLSLALAA